MVSVLDFADYLVGVAPLVVLHLVVPPLNSFPTIEGQGLRLNDDSYNAPDLARLHRSMHLHKSDVMGLSLYINDRLPENWAKWLTYNFAHVSYAHMLGNVSGLLLSGYDAWNVFGSEGMYVLFFAGGVVAALPSPLKAHQEQGVARKAVANLTSWLPRELQGQELTRKISSKAQSATKWAVTAVQEMRPYAGSSGSVYCLMGASLAKMTYDLFQLACGQLDDTEGGRGTGTGTGTGSSDGPRHRRVARRLSNMYGIVAKLPSYANTILSLHTQAMSIYRPDDEAPFHDLVEMFEVAMAGHLQGAAFGFTVMAFTLFTRRRRRLGSYSF
jgi:membrane associated rhomboid family serine protease